VQDAAEQAEQTEAPAAGQEPDVHSRFIRSGIILGDDQAVLAHTVKARFRNHEVCRCMGTGFGGLASRLDMHLVSRCQWQLESYEQDLAAIIVVSRCMNL
jgi:hypothetical protein